MEKRAFKRQILRNEAACPRCGEVLTSHRVTVMHRCACGNLFVGGGKLLIDRHSHIGPYVEMSICKVVPA